MPDDVPPDRRPKLPAQFSASSNAQLGGPVGLAFSRRMISSSASSNS